MRWFMDSARCAEEQYFHFIFALRQLSVGPRHPTIQTALECVGARLKVTSCAR